MFSGDIIREAIRPGIMATLGPGWRELIRAGFLGAGMHGGPLNREEIRRLIVAGDPPLVSGYGGLEAQLQPNGFDLTAGAVARFAGAGRLGAGDGERVLPEVEALEFGADGWLLLAMGAYRVTFNEAVCLPADLMALGRPRSSLLRCGASLHTAVWDAGYRGRGQSLLVVHHAGGLWVGRGARVGQLVFWRLGGAPLRGYGGRYQGEGL